MDLTEPLTILTPAAEAVSFRGTLAAKGHPCLARSTITTLQVNVGKRCNMACHHCHVAASPKRTEEMERKTAKRVLQLLEKNPSIETLDLTGGAPELNPNFRYLLRSARQLGRNVIDRCNLTILLEPGQEDTAELLAKQEVRIVASLPCYSRDNVEKQRGQNVFDKSIQALRKLNALGYGKTVSKLVLDLVYNPVGAFLPPDQVELEAAYRSSLREQFGIEFNRLLTITNMPINRFATSLRREDRLDAYLDLLIQSFNPTTVDELMCRSTLSVGYDGQLYDCDFNQMLELPLGNRKTSIWEIEDLAIFEGAPIATGSHCFSCTAGAGSSCTGALT